MRIDSEALLSGRQIIVGPKYAQAARDSQITVYMGMFNEASYLPDLLKQLMSQTNQTFSLILVDNHSTDDSWMQLLSWPVAILERAKLIRNPLNLGGTGSFILNFSEIETDWFITMHQDDTYAPNHVSVLTNTIKSSSDKDIVFFTDMGTQDMDGKKLFTPIRQSWMANLETPQTTFRANLLQQSVTYPSAAFRTSAMAKVRIPWHSSSFPDTEITLLQASMGNSKFVPELTMLYRMNPKSESHDLNPKERVLGPFAALSRVMASDSFMQLCLSVPIGERESFSKAVLEGIDIRLGESAFSEIVKLIASETMGLAWDYSEPVSRTQIYETYKIAEDGRTTKLLEELGALYSGLNQVKSPGRLQEKSNAQSELDELLNQAAPTSNSQGSRAQRLALTFIGRLLPLPLRRKVVSAATRLYSVFFPKSQWNLAWKPKS
jgi:hypothetical protein